MLCLGKSHVQKYEKLLQQHWQANASCLYLDMTSFGSNTNSKVYYIGALQETRPAVHKATCNGHTTRRHLCSAVGPPPCCPPSGPIPGLGADLGSAG